MDRSRGHKIPTMFTALLKEHSFLYSSVKVCACSVFLERGVVHCSMRQLPDPACHSADGVNTVCHPVQSWVCVFVLLSLCRWSVLCRPVECCLQLCSMLERSGLWHIREVHSNTVQCAIVLLHCRHWRDSRSRENLERKTRILSSKSWHSRASREMKIQFSSSR